MKIITSIIKQFLTISILIIIGVCDLNAQVTIGAGIPPEKAALLQIKDTEDENELANATTGGLLLPRVNLVEKTELYPFYSEGADEYIGENKANAKVRHTGLVVYNLSNTLDLDPGLNLWDGEEWNCLAKVPQKARFDLSCSNITFEEKCLAGKEIEEHKTLCIEVSVGHHEHTGSYNLLATSGNGYSFLASGQITVPGTHTISLKAQGIPIKVQKDSITISNHGTTVLTCHEKIEVLDNGANFTLECSETKLYGLYYANRDAESSDNYIEVKVSVVEEGKWEITSDVVDGLSFSGSGFFSEAQEGTDQILRLYAKGIPTSSRRKSMTLQSNSDGENEYCDVVVDLVIPIKRILGASGSGASIEPADNGRVGDLLDDERNFGILPNSIFKTEKPHVVANLTSATLSYSDLQPYLDPSNGDPVDIFYCADPTNLASDAVNLVVGYVKKGGVFIFFNQNLTVQANIETIRGIFNEANIQITTNAVHAGYVLKMPENLGNPILEGAFGDIRNIYIGEDQGSGDLLQNIPMGKLAWYAHFEEFSGAPDVTTDLDAIYMFQAKDYNFILCADGGFSVANGYSNIETTGFPFKLESGTNKPIPKPNYGAGSSRQSVSNSIVMANILAWALEQAELNGINSGNR